MAPVSPEVAALDAEQSIFYRLLAALEHIELKGLAAEFRDEANDCWERYRHTGDRQYLQDCSDWLSFIGH